MQSPRFAPLSAGYLLFVTITWHLADLTPGNTALSAEPAKRAVLVVQHEYLQNLQLKTELNRYADLVRERFDTEIVVYPVNSDILPAKLRAGLQKLHANNGISAAFLVGQFQFATFHNACGDDSTMFAYYSDLDGQIEDRDNDSKFDFYDPWLQHGKKKPVHELWIAVLRPYYNNQQDQRSLTEIQAYFHKVNEHLRRFELASENQAAILTSKDWPQLNHLHKALEPVYSKRVVQRGGFDAAHEPILTTTDDLRHVLSQPAEICFLYAHSGSSQHVLDAPEFPGNCVLPGVLDYPGRVLLESLDVKSRIISIWGCHALDIQNVKYMNNRFLADSYLFTPHFATQTLLGSSRSIGLEQIEFLIPKCKTQCLAYAWTDYLNHCYSEPFLEEWLAVRGAWEKERYGFDWGYCIYGNPFDKLGLRTQRLDE